MSDLKVFVDEVKKIDNSLVVIGMKIWIATITPRKDIGTYPLR
jgi:hypothetical protein